MRDIRLLSYLTILVIGAFLHSIVLAATNTTPLKDISIVVSSCDKYAQFWDPFFTLLNKHWPELTTTHKSVPIYLISNTKTYQNERVKTINIPDEISWSDNMLDALEHIKTKYILLFLDDYWLDAKVDQNRLLELILVMNKEDAAYLQLFVDPLEAHLSKHVAKNKNVVYKDKFQKYRASLQLAIWETKALKQILRSKESAWDFELAASIRSSGYPKEFLTVKNSSPITYINASHQGHITPTALRIAQAMDPNFKNTMPILQKNNWRLSLRRIRHRANNLLALVKRNISSVDDRSYRYIFQGND